MSNFVLSCCSTADLYPEYFEKRDIKYLSFHFSVDDTFYKDNFFTEVPFDEFYQLMIDGHDLKTSQPNVDEYIEYFTQFLDEGKDILHVCLSSGLSGAYNSARVARTALLDKYPERKIFLVDSMGATTGEGLLIDKMADMRDLGSGIEKIYEWAMDHRLEVHHWIFSTDLKFYVKGGRISKTSGFVGNLLNICPLMNLDAEGHLVPRYKIKGKKKVVEEIVKKMEKHAKDGHDYDGKVFLSHANCIDDAKAVASLIELKFPKLNGRVEIFNIGSTIGVHTGPGTVALFFWGDRRKD